MESCDDGVIVEADEVLVLAAAESRSEVCTPLGALSVARELLEPLVWIAGGTKLPGPRSVLLLTLVVADALGVGDIARGGGDDALDGGLEGVRIVVVTESLDESPLLAALTACDTSEGFCVTPATPSSR